METIMQILRDPLWQFIGAVVALAGLTITVIEFNRKHKAGPQVEPQAPKGEGNPLWKEAINKAVKDFGETRPGSVVEIQTWTVVNDRAQVHVYLRDKPPRVLPPPGITPRPQRIRPSDFCTLSVDRAGDILEIKSP